MGVIPIGRVGAIPRVVPRGLDIAGKLGRFRSAAVTMGETFRLALDSLRAHKLRSFLTLLGVILAVATLVAVMSVVAGLNFYVADRIANLGANVFVVDRFGIITSEDAWVKAQKRPLLTMEEFNRLRETMRTANAIAAIEGTTMDVRSGNQLLENTNVLGVTPNYPEVRNMNLAAGRMISGADETHRSPVCYVGADVAKKFFFNVDPIGKTIRGGAHSYEVIGVAAAIGSAFGQSQDNYMLIPLGTFYKEWHTQRNSMTLFIQARNTEMMAASEDEARMFLRAARHLPWEAEDNFGILGSDSIMSLWKEITGNLEAVVVGLTSIFLVVGGIVIMNIMLVSVTERTREIGVRKALGARRGDILLQFLIEAGTIAVIGGAIGVLCGIVVAKLVYLTTSLPAAVQLWSVLGGLLVALSVGLFFGTYPASKASRLDPVEALRAE